MPLPPSGTVTFLFTDIEASTHLWENHPGPMRIALARHDRILRQAIERNHGYIVKSTGDGVHAAFNTATDALAAAIAAQKALLSQTWPEPVTIRVRMGLHTGAAQLRDGDYFGSATNRAARLMAAGHGGQILLSGVTQDLCRDALPVGVTLLSLGEHRLKDLNRPERLYQVARRDLPDAFPPLRTMDNVPNNLPAQLSSFIGRETAIKELRGLLATTRLLTLTGSGGCGKTRLSQKVASEALEDYPDGVYLVELASLIAPALVPQVIAQALEIPEKSGQPILQVLNEFLKKKRLLLLLDNCEHLLQACAEFASTMLQACPNVRILATSRERLGVTGELTYRVPPLSMPDLQHSATPQDLNPFESVKLFIERALSHKQDFRVTDHNAPALAQICHHLGGIPFALELAAAQVRSLLVEDINAGLSDRFRLLTGGDRTALPRQQTLRAMVDWSYDLLGEKEKIFLERLSVFAGGWALPAAESACGFEPLEGGEVLDLLISLVDKHLVLAEEHDGTMRYGMLETIRHYSAEKLEAVPEACSMSERHRDYFITLLGTQSQWHGPERTKWLDRLEREQDNVRAALARCEADPHGSEAGLRLSAAFWQFWDARSYLSEGREQLERALMRREGVAPAIVAEALSGAAMLAWWQGEYSAARSWYEEMLTLYRKLDDKEGVAQTLRFLGQLARDQGDPETARTHIEESLGLLRKADDKHSLAWVLNLQGLVAKDQSDYGTARTVIEEALIFFREENDKDGVAWSLYDLGHVAMAQGDYAAARSLYEESLGLFREIGDKINVARCMVGLGSVAEEQGNYKTARTLLEESLNLFRAVGHRNSVAASLGHLGHLQEGRGDYETAWAQFEEMLTLYRDMGSKHGVAGALGDLGDVAGYQGHVAKARSPP